MPRHNSGQAHAAEPSHFEHRRARDAGQADESTRRRMLRWIKKTIGIHNPEEEAARNKPPSAPAPGSGARGIAPPGYNPPRPKSQKPSRRTRQETKPRGSQTGGVAATDDTNASGVNTSSSNKSTKVTILLYDEEELHRTLSNASAPNSCRSDSSNNSRRSQTSSRSGRSGRSGTTTPSHTASKVKRSIYEHHHQLPGYTLRPDQPRLQDPNAVRVLIVGGGIGGLCLAQALKKQGIPFTVFERDPTPNFRTQGYRLRINSAGYEALKASLSRENFEVFLQSTGQFFPGFVHVDAHSCHVLPESEGVTFLHDAEITKQVFSANRAMLRSLLLSDLYEGVEIMYSMGFETFEQLPNGRVLATFENGETVEGSVLIGADGTTSRVRRQYVPRHVTLMDTDSGAIYGKTPISPELEQLGLASDCTTVVTSQNPKMSLIIEPQCTTRLDMAKFQQTQIYAGDGQRDLPDIHKYISWVLLARADNFHLDEYTTVQDLYAMAPEQVANVAAQLTMDWDPTLRAIVDLQAPEWGSFMRISTMAPEIRSWAPTNVTLIGDAVHTMAPAGIGCNSALEDAHILAEMFVRYGVNAEAISQYEKGMRGRARVGILSSIEAGQRLYDLPSLKEMIAVVY